MRTKVFLDTALAAASAFAETSDKDRAKRLTNPVASVISVPFQSNWNFRSSCSSFVEP